jgi:secreted Zn-dependent insulinase-like peptidase
LSYSLSGISSGLNISLSGYSHRLPELAKHVFETIKDYRVDAHRLEIMKEQYQIACQNWFLRQPYEIGDSYATYMMSYGTWRVDERAKEIACPYFAFGIVFNTLDH